jgi:hypothetical protein
MWDVYHLKTIKFCVKIKREMREEAKSVSKIYIYIIIIIMIYWIEHFVCTNFISL